MPVAGPEPADGLPFGGQPGLPEEVLAVADGDRSDVRAEPDGPAVGGGGLGPLPREPGVRADPGCAGQIGEPVAEVPGEVVDVADLDGLDVGQPAAGHQVGEELGVVGVVALDHAFLDPDPGVQPLVLGVEPGLLEAEDPEGAHGERGPPVVPVPGAAGERPGGEQGGSGEGHHRPAPPPAVRAGVHASSRTGRACGECGRGASGSVLETLPQAGGVSRTRRAAAAGASGGALRRVGVRGGSGGGTTPRARPAFADRALGSIRVSNGTRTRDILDHNQVLYQLSYTHHVRRLFPCFPPAEKKCTGSGGVLAPGFRRTGSELRHYP
ncbi:hypothetical protein GCM10020221_19150 [Streptomyces thioluteus]|uniref:Uncharacterized protein n=1 Tax=Streptomyces thioluteus TaxID=66431 RepID=A0ABN3WNW5_STRTU